MIRFITLKVVLTSFLALCVSCSWIDRKLAQSNGEYYQTFNCTQELAVLSTKEIIKEMNYKGVIINEDGKHAEIWFKINNKQRARVRFTQHYFWDTIISYYVSPDGNKELSDEFYTKLYQKIFETGTEES
jgi:hypothetical protein